MDNLKKIGFYTLEDKRAKEVTHETALWRCELLLTSLCNFSCLYCRGFKKEDQGDLSWENAKNIVDLWADEGLKNIRFSGGEPTLWKKLPKLISVAKKRGIGRIAISTNGSASFSLYKELVSAGVNDVSVSLDSCCAVTGNKMTGMSNVWALVVQNIRKLSELTYTTIGVVLTEDNEKEVDDIISFAFNLGVNDIRLIPAAQRAKYLPKVADTLDKKYPILAYRINNFKHQRPIRGIHKTDNSKCPLVLDDMAVLNNKHYPCIIYLREHGSPCGVVSENMRDERKQWYEKHNCYKDKICRNNCLDVCVEYNNRVRSLKQLTNKCTGRAESARK